MPSTMQLPYAADPSYCGSYCSDGQEIAEKQCEHGQFCCSLGTSERFCCSGSDYEYDQKLSEDSVCSQWGSYLDWWYITVPLIVIMILLTTMAICYGCRYGRRCCRKQPRRDGASANGMEHGVDMQQRSSRRGSGDFDPNSLYAFEPPRYESLPKDPPTYVDICGQENDAFALNENEEQERIDAGQRDEEDGDPPDYQIQNDDEEEEELDERDETPSPTYEEAESTISSH